MRNEKIDIQLDPENQRFAASLLDISLAPSTDLKTQLLYRCGAAAAEASFRKSRLRSHWLTAAAVLMSLSLGGLAGRWSNLNSNENQIAQSREHVPTSEIAAASDEPTPFFFELRQNAATRNGLLRPAMNWQQLQSALAKQTVSIQSQVEPQQNPAESTAPLSVWMSASELASLSL